MAKDNNKTAPQTLTVAVVVAVYNAAPYLRQCLDSLRAQTYRNFRALCVDDASTDASGKILDEYAALDSRFRVTHLSVNQGLAHARNTAVRNDFSDFVCMLDADDWLSPDAIESAVRVAAERPAADSVLFDLIKVYSSREEHYDMPEFDRLTGDEAFRLSLDWRIHGLALTRGELSRAIPYDETLRGYGDEVATRLRYAKSREVVRCDGKYYYRQHEASLTHAVTVTRFDILRADATLARMIGSVTGSGAAAAFETKRWLDLIDNYMFYYDNSRRMSSSDRHHAVKTMRQAWADIDKSRIDSRIRRKFGYLPAPCWTAFKIEEDIYFTLRKILRRR